MIAARCWHVYLTLCQRAFCRLLDACSRARCNKCLKSLARKRQLQRVAKDLRREIAAAESMILKDDLRHRLRVLRRLGHLESSGMVTKKGHVRSNLP